MNKKAKQYVNDIFGAYREIPYEQAKNQTFNIIHIYDTKKYAYPDGYLDANFIKVVLFNSEDDICYKPDKLFDAVNFTAFRNVPVKGARVFSDGSTLIQFNDFVKVSFPLTQELYFE